MAKSRTIRSLSVEHPGQLSFFEYEEGPPLDGQIRVETLYTGLSAGTELTFVKGTNPYLSARWDADLGVFQEGEPSAGYPINFLGYMEVGRVSESRSPAAAAGDLIAMAYGHKTGHTADPRVEFIQPLPADLDPILGIYAAQMGPICANGLLHAAHDLHGAGVDDLGAGVRDRFVLVTGGGVVGLLTGLFALQHGAAVVAVADATPERLAAARALGLEPLDERDGDAWQVCKARWGRGPGDRGVDVVFQCRGQAASLQLALRALRPQGTVIDLAFYQGGAPELRLGEEFHHNGLSIRSAQIGRVPRGLGHLWDRPRLARATIALLRAYGRQIQEHIITDVVPFTDAPAFVAALAARQRHAIQAVFQVSGAK